MTTTFRMEGQGVDRYRGREKHQSGDEGSLCYVLEFFLYLARAVDAYQAGSDTINCSFEKLNLAGMVFSHLFHKHLHWRYQAKSPLHLVKGGGIINQ